MVNQTDQLKSVFGDALGSPMGFLNTDSNSQPIMSPRIQEDVATPVKPLEKEIENYVKKVSQTEDPIQAVLYAGMLTKGMEKKGGYQSVEINLDENIEAHRSAITEFFKNAIGYDWDPRDYAWCAAFVDATLTKIGADRLGTGEERVAARDYINYGEEVSLDDIREGDIIILDFINEKTGKRDRKGDHVGFHTTRIGKPVDDNRISMLGGNQSYNGARMIRGEGGALSVKGYNKEDVLSVRRITRDTKPWEGVKDQNPLYFYQSKKTLGYGFSEGGLETGDANLKIMQEGLRKSREKTPEKPKHLLETVPFFDRPKGSSIDDIQIGQDEGGNPLFQGRLGTYIIKINPDQRTIKQKIKEGIPTVKKAVGDYLEDPTLPTKEQFSQFASDATVGAVKSLGETMFTPKGTLGDVFSLAPVIAAASLPFDVPKGALRVFGGLNMGEIKDTVSKNTDEYVYVIHGGADFEGLPDLSNPLRTGESKGGRGINPLGEGMYGVVVDSTNVEQALAAIGLAQHYGKKYGTSARFKDKEGWYKDYRKDIDEMFTPGTESYREQFGGEDFGLDEARDIKFGREIIPGQLHLFKIKKSDFEGLLTGDALNKARQKGLGTVDSYKDRQGEPVRTVSWEMVGHFGDSGYKVKEVAIKNPEILERVGKFSLDVDLKEILKAAEKKPKQFAQGGLETGDVNSQTEEALGWAAEGEKYASDNLDIIDSTLSLGKFALESLPGIGTAVTAQDITEELQKENPSYGKIALLGGAELIGLIPGLGTAAKAGLRAAAKKVGLNKVVDAIDAVPTDAPTPKPESEIIAAEKGLTPEEKVTRRKRPENSALPKIKSLTNAKSMKDAGKSHDEIFEATGLYFDPKTKLFRFEIDDTKADIKLSAQDVMQHKTKLLPMTAKNMLLTDFLNHPELFARYPDLNNFNVKIKRGEDIPGGATAYFSPSTKTVTINADKVKDDDGLRNSLFHELQHGIQYQENFDADMISGVAGSNSRYIAQSGQGNSELDKLRNNLQKSVDRHDELQSLKDVDGTPVMLKQMLAGNGSLMDEHKKLKIRIAYETKALSDYSYVLYKRNMGEVEAEVVGERALSDASRLADARKTYMESLPGLSKEHKEKHGPFPENPPDSYFKGEKRDPFYKDLRKAVVVKSFEEDVLGLGKAATPEKINTAIKKGSMSQKDIDSNLLYGKDLIRNLRLKKAAPTGTVPKQSSVSSEALKKPKPSSKPNVISFTKKKEDKELKDFSKNLNLKLSEKVSDRSELVQELQEADIYGNYQKGVKVQGQNYKKEPLPPFTITGLNLKEIKLENKFQQKTLKNVEDRLEIKFQYIEKDGKYYIPMLDIEQANGAKSQVYLDALKQKDTPILGGPTGTVPQQFAQGGSVMNNQMEMAFMQQGGLKDDGMRQDPVSGNPIPNGSMAEEVRDDIPAQLSEGEYVVPADVVRYYGVKHFEDIRNGAKQGLQNMEANGRIGGEPVPVGGPKAAPQQMPQQQQMASDLSQDEMNELQSMMMNVGGFVDQPTDPYQQQQTMYQPPMVMGAQAGTLATNNPTLFATTPSTISSGFSFEPPQQAAPAVDQAAKDAAETAKGTADCAAKGMDYDPVTKTCKPKTPQVTSGDDDGYKPPDVDPNAWMGKYNYTDPKLLSEQITAALTPGGGEGGFLSGVGNFIKARIAPPGSVLGLFSAGSVAAQSAANIMALAKIKGENDPSVLAAQKLLDEFKIDNKLGPIENFITGVDLFKDIQEQNPNLGSTKTDIKPTPSKDFGPRFDPERPDRDTGPSLRQRMDSTRAAGEQAQTSMQKYKKSEAGKAAAAAPAASAKSGTGQDAIDRTQKTIDAMADGVQRGFNKGGLMTSKKKKKD